MTAPLACIGCRRRSVRDDASARGDHAGALRGLAALTAAFPDDPVRAELWAISEGLIAHVFALADNERDPGDFAESLTNLLDRACMYLIWAERG